MTAGSVSMPHQASYLSGQCWKQNQSYHGDSLLWYAPGVSKKPPRLKYRLSSPVWLNTPSSITWMPRFFASAHSIRRSPSVPSMGSIMR